MSDQPVLNIRGEKVALGPHRRDLVPLYLRWMNDWETVRTLSAPLRPMTLESEEAWYDRFSRAEGEALFTIYDLASLRPIGSTGLSGINHQQRTAEFGILIGEKEFRGRGYGTETARLMLDYAFTVVGLHNVFLTVAAYNPAGITAYTRAGFKEFGRRREAWRLGGKAYDIVYMDCLATEFRSPVLHRLLPEEPEG